MVVVHRLDDALPVLRRALAIGRRNWPPADERVLRAQNTLAEDLLRLGRYAEAEPLLLDSYAVMREARGEDDVYTSGARSTRVRLYDLWGRPDEAAPYRAPAG